MKVVPVYFDWHDDDSCYMTEYMFLQEEIAEAFRHEAVLVHDMIYVCPLYDKEICGKRPIFQTVQEAIDDLKMFIYNYMDYPFHEDVQRVPLQSLHILVFQSECAYLEEENRELRRRLAVYEKMKEENKFNDGN